MCVLFLALQQHARYPLILLSNRDEFYQRPSRVAQFWTEDHPDLLAGKDLQNGGTWLGITRSGRLALLTNFRDPKEIKSSPPSRGLLVRDYLVSQASLSEYRATLQAQREQYPGYNIIFGHYPRFFYYSNRHDSATLLKPGYFGLSNHFLNTPWPKVQRGLDLFQTLIQNTSDISVEALMALMQDSQIAPDALLPNTGIGLEKERFLSSIFIQGSHYGTRTTTLVLMDHSLQIQFVEKTHFPAEQMVSYQFPLNTPLS